MAYVLRETDIALPKNLTEIDEECLVQYMKWQYNSKTLKTYVIDPFEEGLLKTIPYNDENRPEEKAETIKNVRGLEIKVTTTPTDKKISYSKLYQEFKDFVKAIEKFHEDERLKKDFMFIKDKGLYVPNSIILKEIEKQKEKSLEGKKGISQKIELVSPKALLTKIPEVIHLVLSRDYGIVTKVNGERWWESLNMIEEGKRRTEGFKEKGEEIKRFKKLVLEESLAMLGGRPKEPAPVVYPFDIFTLICQLEPRETVSYKGIIDSFIKEPPERLTTKSKIGDLKIIEMIEKGLGDELREKGLITEEFLQDYDPRKREKIKREKDDRIYIKLEGLRKRIKDYHEENTQPSLEQNLYPLPAMNVDI